MKVRQIDCNALLPKLLPNTYVPAEVFFGIQIRVVAEDNVLTARRTESCRNARVQRCVCLVDLVAAGNAITPHAAELVEIIEPAAGNKDQILDWRQRYLCKPRNVLGVVADESRLRPERLRNERALLTRINTAVVKSRSQGEP